MHRYTHSHSSCTTRHLSAKYNRTERLLHLFDGSGLLLKHLITTWLHALLCISRRNYPTRLETRTKEFNWIASRRVNWTNQSWSSTGVAKANSLPLHVRCKPNQLTAVQADYCICTGSSDLVYNLCKLTRTRVLIKLKSNLVETRKMVNFARTWWSQVKTWWKLALCGTDVQIVAAWSG